MIDTPRYVLSYFTTEDESLHLAVSADGARFEAVAGGASMLESSVGARSMRDPFIGRGPDGRFHLVATDGWRSRSIVHAVSTDLLTWSEPELIGLMSVVEGTRNTWAPEFFGIASGQVRLIWSSTVSADPDDTEAPQQIWFSDTGDFTAFTPPSVFYAPGYSVIDASAYLDGETRLLAFKDERGVNREGTDHKDLHLVALDDEGHPVGESRPVGSPHLVEGPSVYCRGDGAMMIFDHFTAGRYGAMISTDQATWRAADIVVPPGVRHASVLTLTPDESAAVASAVATRV